MAWLKADLAKIPHPRTSARTIRRQPRILLHGLAAGVVAAIVVAAVLAAVGRLDAFGYWMVPIGLVAGSAVGSRIGQSLEAERTEDVHRPALD